MFLSLLGGEEGVFGFGVDKYFGLVHDLTQFLKLRRHEGMDVGDVAADQAHVLVQVGQEVGGADPILAIDALYVPMGALALGMQRKGINVHERGAHAVHFFGMSLNVMI